MLTENAWGVVNSIRVKKGNELYQKKRYSDALEYYQNALEKDPDSQIIHYNLGTALYKMQDYGRAIAQLNDALLGEDPKINQKAQYNLGNSYYQKGIQEEAKELNSAVASLEKSLGHFEKALQLDPGDQDAQYNYDLVKKELERLKKKLKEKENQAKEQKSAEEKRREMSDESRATSHEPQQKDQKSETKDQRPQTKEQSQETSQQVEGDEPDQRDKAMQKTAEPQPRSDPGKQQAGLVPKPDKADQEHLTQQQAQQYLDRYQQNVEPSELMMFLIPKIQRQEVEKDW